MASSTPIRIWMQDPSTPLGFGKILSHRDVLPGPEDPEIRVCPARGPVKATNSHDFVFDPIQQPEKFRAAHCYGVARIVVDWACNWERRNAVDWEHRRHFRWSWAQPELGPLKLYPDAIRCTDECQLATYSYQNHEIRLFSFCKNDSTGEHEVFAAHSFDIVAHEVGHAIFDALTKRRNQSWDNNDQTAPVKESFADLISVLAFLSRPSLCEALLLEARGRKLLSARFLVEFAEEIALAKTGTRYGIRVLDDRIWIDRPFASRHKDSLKLTSPIVRSLQATFHNRLKTHGGRNEAVLLHETAEELTDIVVAGFLDVPNHDRCLSGVARSILEVAELGLRAEIFEEFHRAFGDTLFPD